MRGVFFRCTEERELTRVDSLHAELSRRVEQNRQRKVSVEMLVKAVHRAGDYEPLDTLGARVESREGDFAVVIPDTVVLSLPS